MSRLREHGLRPPPEKLDAIGWSLERQAFRLFWILLPACPFWWRIDSKEKRLSKVTVETRRARWVLVWLVLLAGLWFLNPDPLGLRLAAAFAALVRLLEIFTTGLGTSLKQSEQARARNLVTIILYAMQVTLIFAILYHSFAPEDFIASGKPGSEAPASHAWDYLYISWSNITSLGNEAYVPRGNVARYLEVLTTTAGILLLGVLLAFGIDAAKERSGRSVGESASDR